MRHKTYRSYGIFTRLNKNFSQTEFAITRKIIKSWPCSEVTAGKGISVGDYFSKTMDISANCHTIRLMLLASLLFCWFCSNAKGIVIVKDGQANATIVVSQDVMNSKPFHPEWNAKGVTEETKVCLAAKEFQKYIEKISGVRLPLVGDSNAVRNISGVTVLRGLTNEENKEGYLIYCKDNFLVLAGNDDGWYQGTFYAVAEFLNRIGARWCVC